MIDHFRLLADYNRWANERLVEDVAPLGPETLLADQGVYFHSIMGLLRHLLVVDALWLGRMGLAVDAPAFLSEAAPPDLETFLPARRTLDETIISFARGLVPERLEEVRRFKTTEGTPRALAMRLCAAQLFNHQTHHRGEIHGLASRLGARCRDIDLLYFAED
ncbi:MAG: DinB family protein [Desulfovibrionaceae bacterium]